MVCRVFRSYAEVLKQVQFQNELSGSPLFSLFKIFLVEATFCSGGDEMSVGRQGGVETSL